MFLSCARENPCIDAFCWDVQTAGMAQEESDIKGETDLDGFPSEIERFPWYDQAVLAEGGSLKDPAAFVKLMNNMLLGTLEKKND